MLHSARRFFFVEKNALLLITIALIFTFFSPSKIYSQEHTDNALASNNITPKNNPSVEAQLKIIGFSSAIYCVLIGIDPIHPEGKCLQSNNGYGKIGYSTSPGDKASGGLLTFASNSIGSLYVPPVRFKDEVNNLARNFGINKKTYAQDEINSSNVGQGFIGLSSIQKLHIKIRDIVYILLVIIFVITGLAIMLRLKIDPRTVMNIQNQIPKLVMGIIFITFSYSIAGLLIDAMWTVTYFGINTITSDTIICETPNKPIQAVATRRVLDNPVAYLSDLLGDQAGCFGGGLLGQGDGISGLAIDVGRTFGDVLGRIVLAVFGMNEDLQGCSSDGGWRNLWGVLDIENCIKKGIFGFIKYTTTLVGGLIIFFALIIAMFKVWFKLLKAYISFTLAVILAPFWIIVGLLPGGGLGFTQWMRHLISHLAVFPATVMMLVLATIFAADDSANNISSSVFLPPLIGNPNIADGIGTLLAFCTIMLTPDLLNMIRDALKTPQGKYTGNIINRAKANPMSAAGTASNFGYQMAMMRHIPWVGPKIPFIKDAPDVMHTRMEPTAKAQGAGPAH